MLLFRSCLGFSFFFKWRFTSAISSDEAWTLLDLQTLLLAGIFFAAPAVFFFLSPLLDICAAIN